MLHDTAKVKGIYHLLGVVFKYWGVNMRQKVLQHIRFPQSDITK